MPSDTGQQAGRGCPLYPSATTAHYRGYCFIPACSVSDSPAAMSQDYLSANSNGGYGTGKTPLGV